MDPHDVQPDELDIAICIDRIQQAAELPVRRVVRAWAGLRSFVADKTPVVGFDPAVPGFFWLAGQGGYGFQTAPAMGAHGGGAGGWHGHPRGPGRPRRDSGETGARPRRTARRRALNDLGFP